jgi:catechol 2,3-dioxygenase-like lactoylglutathione lyase family enzyme
VSQIKEGVIIMLASAAVHPTLPVVDLGRAKKFYVETLGLKLIKEDPSPGAVLQAGGGTKLYLYQRAPTRADHTVAGFTVDDVEATVAGLKARGVVFQELDVPSMGIKTINGIASFGDMKAAWFSDTEGNILAVGDN